MSTNLIDKLALLLHDIHAKNGRAAVKAAIKEYEKSLKEPKRKRKSIPKKWIENKWKKQKGFCKRCGNRVEIKMATGDHRQPWSKGGKHIMSNIDMMCSSCNSSKGNNDFFQESKKTGRTILEQLK